MTEPGTVVVGGGLAAANALSALREGGYDGALALVGGEDALPYERPPLSKAVLQGAEEPDTVFVHDVDWYASRDITLRLGDRAVGIDAGTRTVELASGTALAYTELILATGASPRTLPLPGVDLDGVHTLRTIDDSRTLRAAFASSGTLVVIGAGWIGLEVAAAAKLAGLDVTVLESVDVPLRAALGHDLGAYFADLHRRHGVDLRTGVTVEAIEGHDGAVTGVRADGEVLPADLVVLGVGAVPNTELAESAGLAVDNGVLVDDRLRSSDPHILAAGDVANAHNTALGTRMRVEHWDNAIRQGQLAGDVLLGRDRTYDWHPYFFTDQFDLGMEYVGRSAPDDDTVIRGDRSSGEFIAFWLRDGVVTAAMNVNIWDVSDDLRAVIGQKADPARLADTSVALGDLG